MLKEISTFEFANVTICSARGDALIRSVDFEFPMDEVVEVRGAHGSGKSLLLKVLAGLIRPKRGEYLINGEATTSMRFADSLGYRLNMGYGFGDHGLLGNRTLEQNFLLPFQYHQMNSTASHRRVASLFEMFGLEQMKDYRPGELSGSFRRLAVVARALIFRPKVLLLDNPTTGLTAADRNLINQFILDERKAGTLRHVFLVSRDQHFLDDLVTSCIEIQDNKLLHVPLNATGKV